MAFAAALDLDKPIVMGCSMGGRLVVRLAQLHGSMFGVVIGLDSSDHPQPWYDGSWLDEPAFLRGDFCAALVSGLVAPQSPVGRRSGTTTKARRKCSRATCIFIVPIWSIEIPLVLRRKRTAR